MLLLAETLRYNMFMVFKSSLTKVQDPFLTRMVNNLICEILWDDDNNQDGGRWKGQVAWDGGMGSQTGQGKEAMTSC